MASRGLKGILGSQLQKRGDSCNLGLMKGKILWQEFFPSILSCLPAHKYKVSWTSVWIFFFRCRQTRRHCGGGVTKNNMFSLPEQNSPSPKNPCYSFRNLLCRPVRRKKNVSLPSNTLKWTQLLGGESKKKGKKGVLHYICRHGVKSWCAGGIPKFPKVWLQNIVNLQHRFVFSIYFVYLV